MREVTNHVDGIWVTIYERAVKDEEASKEADTPMFKNVTYIKKKIPNSRNEYDQPLKVEDRQKYAELVDAFEAGEEVPLNGTPLDEWPKLDSAQRESLKAIGIHTVQQLKTMPETRLPMGFRSLKNEANKWLEQGSELDRLRDKVKELEGQLAQKPKRGRPKKSEAA